MAIVVKSASSPRWDDADHTSIVLSVVFEHLGTDPVEFRALPTDVEAHGRLLFAAASRGDYGPVAAFVAPPVPTRRIHGYTIVARIEAALGPDGAKTKLAAIQAADPVGYARLISAPAGVKIDDPRLLAGIAALSLDADALLAP